MIRRYSVRVDVIRNGATFTSLHPVDAPRIDCKSDTQIKMSMSATFLDDPDVDWMTDQLVPVQVINGEDFPVGVLMAGTVSFSNDRNGVKSVSVEAYDRCMMLNQTKTEKILHFSAGQSYISVIDELLTDAGIVLRLVTENQSVLQTDREDWPIGTSYLAIINALLSEINYGNIWFDASGYARIEPVKYPSAANIDHRYGQDEEIKLLERPCTLETDMFDAPNVHIVVCSNPDLEEPMVSTAVNDNPVSSLSTFKRGRRIAKVYKVDNIPSQAELDAYAQKLMMDGMITSEVATFSTANLPGHGVYDTIAIMHPDLDGIFQEVAWSLVLAPGQSMTHKVRRSIIV